MRRIGFANTKAGERARALWEAGKLGLEYADTKLSRLTAAPLTPEQVAVRRQSCLSCPHFLPSKTVPGCHVCGACTCGERKILEREWETPRLRCKEKRPGFWESEE